jgi:hypothetical protein
MPRRLAGLRPSGGEAEPPLEGFFSGLESNGIQAAF